MCKLLLTLMIIVFAQGCKTKIILPAEMPDDVQIIVSEQNEDGDRTSTTNISAEKITVFKGSGWHNRTKVEHPTNKREVEKLYQVFIENKFDQIEPESYQGKKSNNIGEIMIIWDKKSLAVHPNSLTYSEENMQRIQNINTAILNLIETHTTQEIKE